MGPKLSRILSLQRILNFMDEQLLQTIGDCPEDERERAASMVVANCLVLAARLHVGYSKGRNDEELLAILREMIVCERSKLLQ